MLVCWSSEHSSRNVVATANLLIQISPQNVCTLRTSFPTINTLALPAYLGKKTRESWNSAGINRPKINCPGYYDELIELCPLTA
jgi:hypothetical protein